MYEGVEDYLFLWMKEGWAPPYRIHICPTDTCNLQCLSCWRSSLEHRGNLALPANELTDERFLSLIDEAINLGVREIELTGGGEPLIRKKLVTEAIKKIKKSGLCGTITTNATLFSSEDVKLMVDLGWDEVIISLDGPTPQINDLLRPPEGSFYKTMQALSLFKNYKAESGKNKPRIVITCVLSKVNAYSIAEMISLGIENCVEDVIFQPLIVLAPEMEKMVLTPTEVKDMYFAQIDTVRQLVHVSGITTNFWSLYNDEVGQCDKSQAADSINKLPVILPDKYKEFLRYNCYEPWYRMHINSIGKVSPCCMVLHSENDNIKERSLNEIWSDTFFSEVRQGISHNQLLPVCVQCALTLSTHTQVLRLRLFNLISNQLSLDKTQE